jgi:hypothetical protein
MVPYHKLPLGQRWLLELRHQQEGEPFPVATAEDDTYRKWGFRVYRTSYAPSSDQKWEEIIQKLRASVHEAITVLLETEDDDPDAQKLSKLFHLDIRSDAATMDGLDLDQVREIHRSAAGLDGDLCTKSVLLVADRDVFKDDSTWIKCVDTNYMAADYDSAERYFGWMKMTTESVADLWFQLEFRSGGLEEFAPRTIGGMHLEVWEGAD